MIIVNIVYCLFVIGLAFCVGGVYGGIILFTATALEFYKVLIRDKNGH